MSKDENSRITELFAGIICLKKEMKKETTVDYNEMMTENVFYFMRSIHTQTQLAAPTFYY